MRPVLGLPHRYASSSTSIPRYQEAWGDPCHRRSGTCRPDRTRTTPGAHVCPSRGRCRLSRPQTTITYRAMPAAGTSARRDSSTRKSMSPSFVGRTGRPCCRSIRRRRRTPIRVRHRRRRPRRNRPAGRPPHATDDRPCTCRRARGRCSGSSDYAGAIGCRSGAGRVRCTTGRRWNSGNETRSTWTTNAPIGRKARRTATNRPPRRIGGSRRWPTILPSSPHYCCC